MLVRAPRDSLMAESRQTTALWALEQHPVAAIAVADDGAVLFANTALAKLLCCSCDALTSMSHEDICSTLPAGETLFAVARLCPNTIGRSLQLGQTTCFVKVCKSAISDGAESVAMAMFEGLTERLSEGGGAAKYAACADSANALCATERLLTCGAQPCWSSR
jgi:hypothetical protein